jgi:hypothetical protein
MRIVVAALCLAACASSQGPTIHRSYLLPGAPYNVAQGFPLVLAATRQVYPVADTRPERGALLTATHRLGADEVAFLVSVTPWRVRTVKHRNRRHVELTVTVDAIVNRQLVSPDRVPAPILDEENHLLAVISAAGEPYTAAMPPGTP